jgi:ElaB/YqjD/DUF883 family membrane-anchored ribosome-binding protein
MIQQQSLEANWDAVAQALSERWSGLNQSELQSFRSNPDELVAEIQRRTGESQDTIRGYLEELSAGQGSTAGGSMQAARQYVHRAGAAIQTAGGRMSEGLRSSYTGAEHVIRERPGQTLIAAFGAGLIVGTVVGLLMRPR